MEADTSVTSYLVPWFYLNFKLEYTMFVCVKGHNENKRVGRNKIIYFLWIFLLSQFM